VSAVRASIDIAAPPDEVWAVVMDPDHLGDWVTIHRGVKRASDNPLTADSTMEQRLCLRGVSFNVTWKVKEFDPPHLAVMEGRGPARSQAFIRDELTAVDGGTRFDYVNEFKPPMGPLGLAAGRVLVGGLSQREANASLQKLKALVEHR
jgi:uncharacterized protein YndB with AHSA1/START domain